MVNRQALSPELSEAVRRARIAIESDVGSRSFRRGSNLHPEAIAVIAEWVESGAYDRAIADLEAVDPDLVQ